MSNAAVISIVILNLCNDFCISNIYIVTNTYIKSNANSNILT